MNASDILRLVNAGFSKDEIIKLFALDNAPAQGSDEAQSSVPPVKNSDNSTDTSDSQSQSTPDLSDITTALDNKISELSERMDKMLKTMQDANLQGSRIPNKPELDDILASIINPQ